MEEKHKHIIIVLAVLYECSYVRFLKDDTKSGYVLEGLQSGELFNQHEEIISELKNIMTDDRIDDETRLIIQSLVINYEINGLENMCINCIKNTIFSHTDIKKILEKDTFHGQMARELMKQLIE